MTEKLYYSDSHLFSFEAKVLSCVPAGNGAFTAVLDRTCFFPESGGQKADTGSVGPAAVLDVQEKNGEILHYLSAPVIPGQTYSCALDSEQRLRRMQNHSGEHIVSGIVHNRFGYENVGFHMADCMTIDFSGELTLQQLSEVETLANETVRANVPIKAYFPSPEELSKLQYRSKLELTENVRIVIIEGTDVCACCAPHVSRTGEIGVIKLLSAERHRGGTRVTLICGMDALDDYRARQQSVTEISEQLSSKRGEVSDAVKRLAAERDSLRYSLYSAEMRVASLLASAVPETKGSICLFESLESEAVRRELVNLLVPKCGGMAAVFFGSDDVGYKYIIGSKSADLRAKAKEINSALQGRGGGKPEMISGTASAAKSEIEAFFKA